MLHYQRVAEFSRISNSTVDGIVISHRFWDLSINYLPLALEYIFLF